MMMDSKYYINLKKELFAILASNGSVLMGVGDLNGMVSGKLKIGVSVAVPVPKKIVQDLEIAPTKEYYEAYHDLNMKLNGIVSAGAEFLQKKRFQCLCQYNG